MKKILLSSTLLLFIISGFSQTNNFWSVNNESPSNIIADKSTFRLSYPKEVKLFNLNFDPFQQVLFSVVDNKSSKKSAIISLPNAAGNIEQFAVYEASNFDQELQAKFPEIRSYSGKGITDKHATLKLSISPQGIQAMVFRTDKENEFIEPYSQDHTIYSVYISHRDKGKLPWNCSTADTKLSSEINKKLTDLHPPSSTGNLKTMRLAQSVTAEYSNYFGATSAAQVSLVLAAINATLTRCNGVYEKDLAVHLNLIAATTNVIYYNASTDPYSAAATGAGGAWNSELQNTLTSVIGEANYDIGHLFGASGGGGNAGCIGCVCTNGSKGSGFTSPADGIPQGDNFDIDYVVHEVGHQMGANHTFSFSNEGTGVNKEVGSGITIMGYAGITSQDVAAHSIDIYHEASIAQIQANLATKSCPVTSSITNSTPVVGALSNYTIPVSTPFALTGSATDANGGDVLTYCWEQNDNASSSQTGSNSKASATKATGPNWISFRPTVSPTRYFPQLSSILAGSLTTGPLAGGDAGITTEALSSVSRILNFRLTVRDNAPYISTSPVSVGQTQFKDMVVTVSNTSGPFAVTSPNTAVSWAGSSSQTITWSVANTTASPVSCTNVKVSLSTDGGQTFPTVLSASTANDGSEVLTIPNTATTTARIKVEAVGNIFFDISNSNFTITAGPGCGAPTGLTASGITTTGATVSWTAVSGAVSYDVDYKLTSSGTWTNAATATASTSVAIGGLTANTIYDWRVRTNCSGSSSTYTAAQFTTASAPVCNAPSGLASSGITSSGATVSWTAVSGANSYDVDYKLTSSGTWTNAATATTSTSVAISGLTANTVYDWRVRTNCSFGSSGYSTAQFTTAASGGGCQSSYDNVANESFAAAVAIPTDTDVRGLISTTTDNDWYKVTLASAGTLTVTLGTLPGDYDVKLFNSSQTQVGISQNGGTTSETINYSAAAGTYYIQVYGYNGANSTTVCYTLKAAFSASSSTCPSTYDNSTNGTFSGAVQIPLNTDVKGLINTTTDNDYYKFTITNGGTLTVSLTTLPGDFDVRLYNSAQTQVGISQNGSTTSESIPYTAAAGTYYVRVYGYSGANSTTICYTLKIIPGTASKGSGAVAAGVQLFPNPASSVLNVNTSALKGKLTISVFDQFSKNIITKRVTDKITQLDVKKLAGGMYYMVIKDENGEMITTEKFVKE